MGTMLDPSLLPRTIVGEDGILRSSSGMVDPSTLPRISGSYADHVLGMADRQLAEDGDRVFMLNAALGDSFFFLSNRYWLTIIFFFVKHKAIVASTFQPWRNRILTTSAASR